jgi:hypothetical protein
MERFRECVGDGLDQSRAEGWTTVRKKSLMRVASREKPGLLEWNEWWIQSDQCASVLVHNHRHFVISVSQGSEDNA